LRKFLFYMPALAGGGAERVWAVLASSFAKAGHEVIFAVDFDRAENRGFLDPSLRLVTLHRNHAIGVLKLAALIRRERPDATLSGIGAANLKHALAALLALRARRAILCFHGFFPSEPQRLSRWANRLTPLLTRITGRAVAVSDGLREALIRDHGAEPRRTQRIHNPVDPLGAPANLSREALAARAPIVLFVGRLVADKDLPTLIDAFRRVTHPEARLDIVGDGPLREEIEARVAAHGLGDRVRFRGYIADPSEAYRRARCLVLTSRFESFGNAVAEGLAHGLPVVTTSAAGPVEIVEQGRYGTVVPIGDAAAVARAIDGALADPGDPAPRQARARQFSIADAARHYLEIIEGMIAEDPR
jgi:glycosyltransferase involved in cell wall biosynthesis